MSKLQLEDAQALDLVLDRTPALAESGEPVVFGGAASSERVRGVQQVLHLLDMLPSEEPPKDLVSRTLRLVNESVTQNAAAAAAAGVYPGQRPLA